MQPLYSSEYGKSSTGDAIEHFVNNAADTADVDSAIEATPDTVAYPYSLLMQLHWMQLWDSRLIVVHACSKSQYTGNFSDTAGCHPCLFLLSICCSKARQMCLTGSMGSRAKKPCPTRQNQCTKAAIDADLCSHHLLSCLCRRHAKKSRDAREQRRDSLNQHEIATGDAGLFSLINTRLGDRPGPHQPHQQAASHRDTHPSSLHNNKRQSKFADGQKVAAAPRPPDRKALIAHQVSC